MKTILWSLLLFSLSSFSGCNRQEASTVQPTDLSNVIGKWKLSSPKTDFTITLDITKKSTEATATTYQLTGLSPVNQYGAEATIQANGAMSVGSIIATKRGGAPEAMNTETAYFNSLQKALKVEIIGQRLKITSASDTQLSIWDGLIFDKQ